MKEVKNEILKLRISASNKQEIKEYAEAHNITLSELVRKALMSFIALEGEKKDVQDN